jgi:preprotein translocase subunit Sec61beta
MAEKEKQYMPQSGAGLMRYNEGNERIKMSPNAIIAISIGFAGIVLLLKFFA